MGGVGGVHAIRHKATPTLLRLQHSEEESVAYCVELHPQQLEDSLSHSSLRRNK